MWRNAFLGGRPIRAGLPALLLVAWIALPLSARQTQGQTDWRLEPFVRLGELDGPLALTEIGGVVVVEGNLAIAQSMERLIRVVSPSGALVRTIGRQGEGPGEFRRIDFLGWVDDELMTVDLGLRRITYFSPTGEVLRTHRLPQPPIDPPALWIGQPFGASSGRVILTASVPYNELPRLPVVLATMAGEVLDTLAWFDPQALGFRVEYAGNRGVGGPHPMRQDLRSVSPNGRTFVKVLGAGNSVEVTWYDTETREQQRRRIHSPAVAVPAGLVEHVQDSMLALFNANGIPATSREVRDGMPFPTELVGASLVRAVNDGGVWFQEPALAGAGRYWRRVTQAGGQDIRVELPASIQILDQVGDTVWAKDVDEFGVNYVVGYLLHGPSRGTPRRQP